MKLPLRIALDGKLIEDADGRMVVHLQHVWATPEEAAFIVEAVNAAHAECVHQEHIRAYVEMARRVT